MLIPYRLMPPLLDTFSPPYPNRTKRDEYEKDEGRPALGDHLGGTGWIREAKENEKRDGNGDFRCSHLQPVNRETK